MINYFNSKLKRSLQHLSLPNISLFLFAFFISISNSISAIIIIFFLISFLLSKNKYKNIKRVVVNPINKSIFIFFLFTLLSYLWCENNFFFHSISKYSILLIVPFLDLLNYKEPEKNIATFFFICGIIFNITCSFIISVLYQFEILNTLFFLKHDHYQNEFFLRGFIDHSNLSILVSFTFFIFLSYLFEKKIKNRNFLFILIFILILFLLNSYGRTGLFIIIILLPVFFLIKSRKNIKSLLFFLFIILLTSITISNPFKNRIKTTFNFQKDTRSDLEKIEEDAQYMADSLGTDSFRKDINYWKKKINEDLAWKNKIINKERPTSMGKRYKIWKYYKEKIMEKPLLGKGAGEVQKIININKEKAPHNNYILITFELGVIGLILFLHIFYIQIKSFFVEKKQSILKLIFPLLFLNCMIINDYIIIYNTSCFFSLFTFLLYSKENDISN